MLPPPVINEQASEQYKMPEVINLQPLYYAIALVALTAGILVFGEVMLYSASFGQAGLKYFRNQAMWGIIGTVAAITALAAGYRKISASSLLWLGLCFIGLLVAGLFFEPVKGASRWVRLGPVSIQPSEFAKVAVIIFTANYCAKNYRSFFKPWHRCGLLPLGAGILAVCGAILYGHDLGTTVLVAISAFLVMLVAGLSKWYLIVPGATGLAAFFYIRACDAMRWGRITSFLRPEEMQTGKGYQLWTSLIALGSGDWFGVGFMASRMKERYLPEAHTDFICSVIGEELGYVSLLCLIAAYVMWGFFAIRIALRASGRLGTLLGFGLTMMFCLQASINLAVVSGSMPTKGMPAPFLSYGGSSLLSALIATGIIVSIAVDSTFPGYELLVKRKIRSIFSFRKKAENNETSE